MRAQGRRTPGHAFPAFDDLAFAERLAERLGAIAGVIESRRFPDQETYLRLLTPVAGRDAIFLGSLDRPDPKLARLVFLADAGERGGARAGKPRWVRIREPRQ